MTRDQLNQLIKEEVESVLFEDDGAEDRFKFQWAYQFRRPQNKTTLDQMISDYDVLVDYLHNRTEPITNEEPQKITDQLFDENPELTFDALIKGLVSRTLVGVPVEALKRIPKSKGAKYIEMALDRLASQEKRSAARDTELARDRTPEEKEAAAIKFGQDMAAGKYGKLD